MFVICSTIENEVICCIDSPVSMLAVGSWFCSWATNSFRKPSLSIVVLFFAILSSELSSTGFVTVEPVMASLGIAIQGQARTSTRTPSGRTRVVSAGAGAASAGSPSVGAGRWLEPKPGR